MKHGDFIPSGNYLMEVNYSGDVPHYAAKILCRGDGNERRTVDDAIALTEKIADALNERDNLIVQRNALRDALEAFVGWATSSKTEYADFRVVLDGARKEIAKVKGESK